jgi:hypothetical protein
MSGAPLVMVYVDGPVRIGWKRARLMVSQPFHLDPPSQGLNSEYIQEQTRRLQLRMMLLMKEFIQLEQ